MIVSIGNDHAGVEHKKEIIDFLKKKKIEIINHGTNTKESVDYPDFIHPVASDVNSKKALKGIIICGSGNGVSMTANKYPSKRAALCWNAEIAKLAREHNDANVLCIPARFVSVIEARKIILTFLTTEFEGGRHERRVKKINANTQGEKKNKTLSLEYTVRDL